jgi:hypothetical protein
MVILGYWIINYSGLAGMTYVLDVLARARVFTGLFSVGSRMRPVISEEAVERLTYAADVHTNVRNVRTSSVETCLLAVLDRLDELESEEDSEDSESVDAEQLRQALAEEEEEPTGGASRVSVGRSGDWM